MSANSHQVGGGHYASGFQHWDLAFELYGVGYFQGQVTKYVYRWRKKNGVQDLEKALHFLQKMRELLDNSNYRPVLTSRHPTLLNEFALMNDIGHRELTIMSEITICSSNSLRIAEEQLTKLIEEAKAEEPGATYAGQG